MLHAKLKLCASLKIITACFVTLILFFAITNCTEQNSLPPPLSPSVLSGQVFNLSHPGPIPIGWVPPPYEAVCTVIAQDVKQNIIFEVETDKNGKFQLKVFPGTYYLHVKESRISSITGPYSVREGEMIEVQAYFDNGMR